MSATKTRIFRLDSEKQKLNWEKIDNGAYRAFITLGVADLPLEYVNFKGDKHIETITQDELFNSDSLATAISLPICLGHPKYGVYGNNKEGLLIGHTLETLLNQDGKLLLSCVVDDKRGIELIDSMIAVGAYAEVSPGYWVNELRQDSTGKYLQIGRKYDHIALLLSGEGRGGQAVVLRTDSNLNIDMSVSTTLKTCAEQIQSSYEDDTTTVQTNCVETFANTDESEYGTYTTTTETITQKIMTYAWKEKEYSDLAVLASDANLMLDSKDKQIATLQKQLTESTSTVTQKNRELEAANGRLDAMKIQLDAKQDLITLDAANLRIKESIELWQKVEPIFKQDNKDFAPDYSLSPVEIKKVYITQYQPKINLDGKSEEYVNAVWDTISVNLDTLLADKLNTDAKDKVQSQLLMLQNTDKQRIEQIKTDSAEDGTKKALEKQTELITGNHR